jgi:hypothetical protein
MEDRYAAGHTRMLQFVAAQLFRNLAADRHTKFM